MGAGRIAKSRQLLEDWIIDPSFGRTAARYRVAIETSEELKSDDEVVSKSRLEVLEGDHRLGRGEVPPPPRPTGKRPR